MTSISVLMLITVIFGAIIAVFGMAMGLLHRQNHQSGTGTSAHPSKIRIGFIIAPLFVLVMLAMAWLTHWYQSADTDHKSNLLLQEKQVKTAVKESQIYETLNIYEHPESFNRNDLHRYWLTAEQGGKASVDVEQRVHSLLQHDHHYGPESTHLQFDFTNVEISPMGTEATVTTHEEWLLYVYDKKNTLVSKIHLPPYDVKYTLRKLGDKWFLDTNSTSSFSH